MQKIKTGIQTPKLSKFLELIPSTLVEYGTRIFYVWNLAISWDG